MPNFHSLFALVGAVLAFGFLAASIGGVEATTTPSMVKKRAPSNLAARVSPSALKIEQWRAGVNALPLGINLKFHTIDGLLKDLSDVLSGQTLGISSTYPGYDVQKVAEQAIKLATHSWEFGICTQGLIDVYTPDASVYSKAAFPKGRLPSKVVKQQPGLTFAQTRTRTNDTTLANGAGALGDPASLVPGALLVGAGQPAAPEYLAAVDRQMDYLFKGKRFPNGAISQRESVVEAWADQGFMIPPSIAYYGVYKNKPDYVKQAAEQYTFLREILQANTTASWKGLWVHIVGPQSQTLGIWLTGNGWVALGMLRTLATMRHWAPTAGWDAPAATLEDYVVEILRGAQAIGPAPDGSGLLANYLVGDQYGQDNAPKANFGDSTGSAMLASAAYRLAVLNPAKGAPFLAWATDLRLNVARYVNASGVLEHTVDPLDWYKTTSVDSGSPEGNSALLLLAAAWRDCLAAEVCGAST